jgi:hypothetical protein
MRTDRTYPDQEQCMKIMKWLNEMVDTCTTHDLLLTVQSQESDVVRAICLSIIVASGENRQDENYNHIVENLLFVTTTFTVVVFFWSGFAELCYYVATVLCMGYILYCSETKGKHAQESTNKLVENILSSSADILLDFYLLRAMKDHIPDTADRVQNLPNPESIFIQRDLAANHTTHTVILRALSGMHSKEQYKMLSNDRIDLFAAMCVDMSLSEASLHESQLGLLFAMACKKDDRRVRRLGHQPQWCTKISRKLKRGVATRPTSPPLVSASPALQDTILCPY